jgi:hypothetical protein
VLPSDMRWKLLLSSGLSQPAYVHRLAHAASGFVIVLSSVHL